MRSSWSTTSSKPTTGNIHLFVVQWEHHVGFVYLNFVYFMTVKAASRSSWSCSTATTSCLRSWGRNPEKVDCLHTRPPAAYCLWASYQLFSLCSSGKCLTWITVTLFWFINITFYQITSSENYIEYYSIVYTIVYLKYYIHWDMFSF